MEEESNTLTMGLLEEHNTNTQDNENGNGNGNGKATTTLPIADEVTAEDPSLLTETVQEWERGEKQPSQCHDSPYALFFLLQFFLVFFYGISSTVKIAADQDSDQDNTQTDNGLVQNLHGLVISALGTVVTTIPFVMLSFVVLTRFGSVFITFSIWLSVAASAIMAILAFVAGSIFLGVMLAFSAAIGCWYAFAVRDRIPFAAANLSAGTTAVKMNMGVIFLPLFTGFVLSVWLTFWSTSLYAVTGAKQVCPDGDNDLDNCTFDVPHSGWIFPWVFFLFWTQQVLSNFVHTTVAGIVSTWYFVPTEANGWFSPAIRDSTKRSITNSFGSICFGSLLVAIIKFLDFLVQTLRQNGRNGDRQQNGAEALLLCCLDCILRLLEGIMEYFNKWAFIYVGIYGYDYLTAGKKVMNLFTQRGWTVVINDNLVSHALGLVCFTVSVLSALTSLIFMNFDNEDMVHVAFFSNFAVALVMAITMMTIIDSAVSTVIVCFGEAPEALQENHQTHSTSMKEAWSKVYPLVRC